MFNKINLISPHDRSGLIFEAGKFIHVIYRKGEPKFKRFTLNQSGSCFIYIAPFRRIP